MLTTTLGGLIKDYRIKKRLSQLEVSLRIGWSDTTRLSKIEQGRVGTPTRKTIDKILDALELTENERADMLIAANLVPTKEEARIVLKKLEKNLQEIDLPIILVDYTGNTYFLNKEAKELFQITDKEYKYMEENTPNWVEAQFLTELFNRIEVKAGYTLNALIPYKEHLISHFKFEQAANLDEKWMNNLLTKLSKDKDFRELWAKQNPFDNQHIYGYEVNEFSGIWNDIKRNLIFSVQSARPAFDFRFSILIYQPMNKETFDFYNIHKINR